MLNSASDIRSNTRLGTKREGSLLCLCGGMLMCLAIAMIPSLFVALLNGEDVWIMGVPIVIGLLLGSPLFIRWRIASRVRPPDVLAMMAVIWLTCFVFGMVPFIMAGLPFIDSLFESASGFTTTGVDSVVDVFELPKCILFWRCTTSWIGGIMIILIFMLLMPMVGGGTRSVIANETSGSTNSSNRSMRLKDAAVQFIRVYVFLTFLMAGILMLMSYSIYDAIALSFTTISTGGFLASPTEFTPALKIVIMAFMFLGATNFYLHYRAIYQKDLSVYGRNKEFKVYVFWCIGMAFVLLFLVGEDILGEGIDGYVNSLFMVVSASSTTGHSYIDFGLWSYPAMVVLYIIALIGASAGSTSGGMKISRMVITLKALSKSFVTVLRPHTVSNITMDGSVVPKETVRGNLIVVMMFVFTTLIFSLIMILCGYNGTDSISCVIAMISNFGTAVGQFGPAYGYAAAPEYLKMLLILMMWIGRLEILVALAILSPRVWKELIRDFRYSKWKNSQ